MNASGSGEGPEQQLLANLGVQYEKKGYRFLAQPSDDDVPEFLRPYRPDAIARRGDEGVVIEVKSRISRTSDILLRDLRNRLKERPNWRMDVVYARDDRMLASNIPLANREMIEIQVSELETLIEANQLRAAFVLSWSVLEASLGRISQEEPHSAISPAGLVQGLASLGYLDRDAESNFRALSDLRNRVAHGDLYAQVSREDVLQVINLIKQTLVSEAGAH